MDRLLRPLVLVVADPDDRERCDELHTHLRALAMGDEPCELACNLYVDPGDDAQLVTARHVERAAVVVPLCSARLLTGPLVERILDRVRERGTAVKVVPAKIASCDLHGWWFAHIEPAWPAHWPLDSRDNRDAAFTRAVQSLRGVLDKLPAPPRPVPAPIVPVHQISILTPSGSTVDLVHVSNALTSSHRDAVEQYREHFRCGERAAARASIVALRSDPTWGLVDAPVRAETLRLIALWHIHAGGDTTQARAWFEEARALDPAFDEAGTRARLALAEGDRDEALRLSRTGSTLGAQQLHVALLLEAHQTEEAAQYVAAMSAERENDPEIRRLTAYRLLLDGEVDRARTTIQEVLTAHPKWQTLREAAAIIDFWSSCARTALEGEDPLMPRPFPVELTRLDSESRRRRHAAAAVFADLAEEEQDPTDHDRWRFWRFVCLAQDFPHAPDAHEALVVLLAADAGHPLALAWAVAREFTIDQEVALDNLAAAFPEQPDYLGRITIQCTLLLEQERCAEVGALLDTVREAFESERQSVAWRRWRTIAHARASEYEAADDVANTEPDPELRRQNLIAVQQARYEATGERGPLRALLEEHYAATGSRSALLEACELAAQEGDWLYVYEKAPVLLGDPTPALVQLAVHAAWATDHPEHVRGWLDQHQGEFPERRWPPVLARLRVLALRRLGLSDPALAAAQDAWEVFGGAEQLLTLFDEQWRQSDTSGLLNSARRLLVLQDARPLDLIRVARLVALYEQDLAALLWRRAVTNDSPDDQFVVEAFLLGIELDLHAETLARRFAEVAGRPGSPAQLVDISQFHAWMAAEHEAAAERQRLFRSGLLGLHLRGDGVGGLAHALLTTPAVNRATGRPAARTPVFVRHGSRSSRPLGRGYHFHGRLALDISALLVAYDLQLLPDVEQHFAGRLFISQRVPEALTNEMGALAHYPRQRMKAIEQLEAFVRAGHITLFRPAGDPMARHAAAHQKWALSLCDDGGVLVGNVPAKTLESSDAPPPEHAAALVRIDAVIDHLDRQGDLSSGAPRPERAPEPEPIGLPADRARMGLNLEEALLLAERGLLPGITSCWRIELLQSDWDACCAEKDAATRNQETFVRLKGLQQRLGRGIRAKTYQFLPDATPLRSSEANAGMSAAEATGLRDLVSWQATADDLVWTEDRWLSRYRTVQGASLVGLFEVLGLVLPHKARVSERKRYYGLLHCARESHHRYLPLLADEITFWLDRAKVVDGRVRETPELATLRQYWASAFLEDGLSTLNEGNQPGEAPFVIQSQSAITAALGKLWGSRRWASPSKKQDRRARAEWLLTSLYTPYTAFARVLPAMRSTEHKPLAGFDLGELLDTCITIEDPASRADYLNWIQSSFVGFQLAADPDSAVSAAQHVAKSMAGLLDSFGTRSPKAQSAVRDLIGRFVPDLPDEVRLELHRDTTLMNRLRLTLFTVMEIGDAGEFCSEPLWRAAELALRKGHAELTDADGRPALLTLTDEGELRLEAGKKSLAFAHPWIPLLQPRPLTGPSFLVEMPELTDGVDRTLPEVESELWAIDDPATRMERLLDMVRCSAAHHYAEVESRALAGRLKINAADPPDEAALRRFLRLERYDPEQSFPANWDAAAARMLCDVGLAESLWRAALLPVPVPAVLRDALVAHASPMAALTILRRRAATPIVALHLLDLALSIAPHQPEAAQLAQEVAEQVASDRFVADAEVLRALANLARRAFRRHATFRALPLPVQLALVWGHASTFHGVSQARAPLADEVVIMLEQRTAALPWTDFQEEGPMAGDVSHPDAIRAPALRYHGLGAVLMRHPPQAYSHFAAPVSLAGLLRNEPVEFLSLTRECRHLTDALGSWWGKDPSLALAPLLGAGAAAYGVDAIQEAARGCLERLETDPNHYDAWMQLHLLRWMPDSVPEWEPQCRRVAGAIDLRALLDREPMVMMLCALTALSWRENRDAAGEALASALAADRRFTEDTGADVTELCTCILEVAYSLWRGEPDRQIFDTGFAALVEQLFQVSPVLARVCAPIMLVALRYVPLAHYPAVQRLALVARASY